MAEIMVLKMPLIGLLIVLFLSSCGAIPSNKRVVPAYTDPLELEESKKQEDAAMKSTLPSVKHKAISKKKKTSLPAVESNESASSIPSPLIVQSLIERAEKAISMQQWLRAQHALEQAIHISPGGAKVFLIYGDVYFNLGILEQAEQMYLRAISLAGESSAIGRLAMKNLNALK